MNLDLKSELLKFKKDDGLKKSTTIVTDKYLNQYEEVFEDGVFKKKLVGNKKKDGNMSKEEQEYYLDRKICKVVEGVHISGGDAAQSKESLTASGITHVVCLAASIGKPFPNDYKYHVVDIADLPDAPLLSILDDAVKFVEEAVSQKGQVLVHCSQGVSRSASVVMAYLMKTQRIPYARAFEITAQARPQIRPNYGFEQQLAKYEAKVVINNNIAHQK